MKKLTLFIITLFALFFGINSVNAMSLKVTGETNGKRGETVTLYITLSRTQSEKEISAVDGTLSYDESVLELQSATNLMTGWTEFGSIGNVKTFAYGNLTFNKLITVTTKDIVKMIFKIKANANYGETAITVTNPSATDETGETVTVSGGTHKLKVLSDINTLSGITVSSGTIDFNENTKQYSITTEETSINIGATKTDASSSITGDLGTKTLNYGLNTFKITVTSESGVANVYTIKVTRPDNRKKINTLENITLSEGKISFDKETTAYNVNAGKQVNEITVDATLSDETSSFVSGYGPRTIELKTGQNIIEIKVKAENESIKTYKIVVTKEDPRSNNNFIKKITLSDGKITFDKEMLEYETTILYEIKKIDIQVELEDSKSTYEITGNDNLKVGENLIIITVKAENESTREYKIRVVRKEESEALSNNSKLNSLIIDGYSINFSPTKYEYTIKIAKEEQLQIHYQADDKGSIVSIQGNENLKNGSIIIVKVTAEDGTKTEYKITVAKSDNNIFVYIIIGIVVLILIIIVGLILGKNKPKTSNGKEIVQQKNTNKVVNEVPIMQNIIPQVSTPVLEQVPTQITESQTITIQPEVNQNVIEKPNINSVNEVHVINTAQPIQQSVTVNAVEQQTAQVNTSQNTQFFETGTQQNIESSTVVQGQTIPSVQKQIVETQHVQNNQNFTN